MLKLLAAAGFVALLATPAYPASGDAWAEFAKEVEDGCRAASSELLTDAVAVVDPFGSESYGLAVVTGTASDGSTKSVICVFDKQAKTVEIGGELDFSTLETPAS